MQSARLRKLIGLFAILGWLAAYVVAATWVAEQLPEGRWIELAYYVVAGVFWFVPIMPLIAWMSRGR